MTDDVREARQRILDDDEITLRIEVDGIVSTADVFDWVVAPMFDLRSQGSTVSRQMWNRPPTEAELDVWVRSRDEDWDFLPVEPPTL